MLRQYFLDRVNAAAAVLAERGGLGCMDGGDNVMLSPETPKNPQFGDFAVNVSPLSKYTKLPPAKTAELIADEIKKEEADKDNFDVNSAAGFINFKLHGSMLNEIISEVLEKKLEYAANNSGGGEKVILEYVSANPTGPFHIGHGRWAAAGSALADIMKYSGFDVYQEFYINDAGSQIQKLGRSLYIRILQQSGIKIDFPKDEEEAKEFYTGGFLIPAALDFINEEPERAAALKENWNGAYEEEQLKYISKYARLKMLDKQQKLLKKFRTYFDNFYSELTLHQSGKVKECLEKLQKAGALYEKDGALWFASSKYGDEKDRVIKKTDGSYTYLAADTAYHYDKLKRGFSKLINIWGADHHGYIPRMKAAIEVLGYNPDNLEILLGQLVNLVINGEEVRMGKRAKMITLDDLIEETGVDAVRYWMIMKSIDTALDFDVELAKSKSDENPVFYVQYAHARACSILRNAVSDKPDIVNNTMQQGAAIDLSNIDLSVLWGCERGCEKSEETAKKLILKLEEYKYIVQTAAKNRTPYLITKYLQELSSDFHKFYASARILASEEKLKLARLAVVQSVIYILQSALKLIGVSAPERM